jgi:hypothetical protein
VRGQRVLLCAVRWTPTKLTVHKTDSGAVRNPSLTFTLHVAWDHADEEEENLAESHAAATAAAAPKTSAPENT